MNPVPRLSLLAGGAISALVALLHVAIAAAGPAWYRYFGAPGLAAAVESGATWPTLLTLAVAVLFAACAVYGLAGARLSMRLPLLRTALLGIGAVYALRGSLLIPQLVARSRGPSQLPLVLRRLARRGPLVPSRRHPRVAHPVAPCRARSQLFLERVTLSAHEGIT